jgi:TolB-like protein/DNA-binding winged helix-turn-helix (wHTH) protein
MLVASGASREGDTIGRTRCFLLSRDSSGTLVRFGPFEFDSSTGELRKHGAKIKLQGQPVEILTLLLVRPGTMVTREELQRRLWPDNTFVDFESSLNAAVKRLRAALCDSADSPKFVETLARRGYRFISAVEFGERAEDVRAVSAPSQLHGESIDSSGTKYAPVVDAALRTSARFGRFRTLTAGGILVFLVVLSAVHWREASTKRAASYPIHALAVLPLSNLSGDPQQDYFAEGMTEELTTQLGKISALRVVSTTSAAAYTQKKFPLSELAREMHVDAIVEGAVLRSGNRVRITVQLIEASTDRHLWAQDYEADMRDVLSLQSQVAQAIAKEIQAKLTPDEQTRFASTHPMDPEAYDDYLRGHYYWYERVHSSGFRTTVRMRNDEDFEKSGRYFEQAVEKDPASALAYTGLTSYYGASAVYGLISPKEGWPKAEAAARKALELDSSLAEAHATMGAAKLFYDWDFVGAEQELRRAIELNPSYPEAHRLYGTTLLPILSRPEESLAQAEIAEQLDPVSFQGTKAVAFLNLRQYDNAIAEFKEILRFNDSSTKAHFGLATAYLGKRMDREAVAEIQKALLLSGDVKGADTIKKAYETTGYNGVIQLRLRQLREKSKLGYVSALDFAELYAELGNKKEAFAWLDKAYGERASLLCEIGISPSLDKLRDDQRFKDLLRKIGLPH